MDGWFLAGAGEGAAALRERDAARTCERGGDGKGPPPAGSIHGSILSQDLD
jgi:hypothetical protein